MARGLLDGPPGVLADGDDRRPDVGVHLHGDRQERPGPAHRAGECRGAERRAGRATKIPAHPVARAVWTARVANDAAPRAELALPPHSLVAAITGAPSLAPL